MARVSTKSSPRFRDGVSGEDGEVLRSGDAEVAKEKVELAIGDSEVGLVVRVGRGEIESVGEGEEVLVAVMVRE